MKGYDRRTCVSVLIFAAILGPLASLAAAPLAEGGAPRILSESGAWRDCIDAIGRRVRVPASPRRVVVHFVSFVAPWYLAGGTAVGIPELSSPELVPPAARGLPVTGGPSRPNVECILALGPDLVILSANGQLPRQAAEALEGAGVPVLLLEYENYGDFRALMDFFLALNGNSAEARSRVKALVASVDALVAQARAAAPVSYLSLFATAKGLKVESSAAHTAYMASLLGGRNVVEGMRLPPGALRVEFSEERIALVDPDVVLVTTMGDDPELAAGTRAAIAASPALSGLRAVREGRIYLLPSRHFLYRPCEEYPEAFAFLAARLAGGRR